MHECYFKSNWKFEFENLKMFLKKHKLLSVFLLVIFPLFIILDVILVIHFLQVGDIVESTMWVIYPIFLILLNPVIYMRPKTYEVKFRGLLINGQLHLWKNFKGYEIYDDRLIILTHTGGTLVLPRYFEDSIKNFLPKLK